MNTVPVWVRFGWCAAGREQIYDFNILCSNWTLSEWIVFHLAKHTHYSLLCDCLFDVFANKAEQNWFEINLNAHFWCAYTTQPWLDSQKHVILNCTNTSLNESDTIRSASPVPSKRQRSQISVMMSGKGTVACSFWNRISNVIWTSMCRLHLDFFLCLI